MKSSNSWPKNHRQPGQLGLPHAFTNLESFPPKHQNTYTRNTTVTTNPTHFPGYFSRLFAKGSHPASCFFEARRHEEPEAKEYIEDLPEKTPEVFGRWHENRGHPICFSKGRNVSFSHTYNKKDSLGCTVEFFDWKHLDHSMMSMMIGKLAGWMLYHPWNSDITEWTGLQKRIDNTCVFEFANKKATWCFCWHVFTCGWLGKKTKNMVPWKPPNFSSPVTSPGLPNTLLGGIWSPNFIPQNTFPAGIWKPRVHAKKIHGIICSSSIFLTHKTLFCSKHTPGLGVLHMFQFPKIKSIVSTL